MRDRNDFPTSERVRLSPDDGVFELAGTEPAWIWVHTCPTPKCSCRSALVLATYSGRRFLLERGAAVREAWNARGGYSRVAATLTDLIVFEIDIDTTKVSSPTDVPFDLSTHPLIASIANRIDGDLLDSIGQLWYRGKGWPDPEQAVRLATEIKIKGWKSGEMVAWDDLNTGVRQDLYRLDDRLYEAADMYCPVPDCQCNEVLIHFETLTPRGSPSPGQILVRRSGEIEAQPSTKGHDRLSQVWAAFQQRHPNYQARFARRYAVVKSIGTKVVQTRPAAPSNAGRNDPCPCGSGKKFKRCCGADGAPASLH